MVSYGFLRDHKTYNLPDFKVGKFGLCPRGKDGFWLIVSL